MITITITSDESLTSLKFDKLLYECTQLGVEVCIRAEFNVAAPKDETDAPIMPNIEPHQWPNFGDQTPPGPNIDEEESAHYYVGSAPAEIPCTITTSSLVKDQAS